MLRSLVLVAVWTLGVYGTEPKPLTPADEAKYLREQEQRLRWFDGMDEGTALLRLRDVMHLDSVNVRSRAMRERVLFGYPDAMLAKFCEALPSDAPVDFVHKILDRIENCAGLQTYLELSRHDVRSETYQRLAERRFGSCDSSALVMGARQVLCARRVRDANGVAGAREFDPQGAEWSAVPAACRERLGTTVSCDFPAKNSFTAAFDCRDDSDCVAIKSGCGLRRIFENSSAVHNHHRCRCVRDQVIRGCFPAEPPAPSRGTGN